MIKYFSNHASTSTIKQLPNFKQSLKIVKICYPNNEITKISQSIVKAKNVQQINLSFNKIRNIESMYDLKKLRLINLSHNFIRNISKNILKLQFVKELNISFNLLNEMKSIYYIFQFFKMRECFVKINLIGNKVADEFGDIIQEKIKQIQQVVKILKQKKLLSNAITEQQQLESNKLTLLPKPAHQSCEYSSKIKGQQITIQSTKPSTTLPINSLSQAKNQLQKSGKSLAEYQQKFDIVAKSNLEGWSQELIQIFKKEVQFVRNVIEIYLNIVQLFTASFSSVSIVTEKLENLFTQSRTITNFIKDQHCKFISSLHNNSIPIKTYKIWVKYYRELRILLQQIKWLICNIVSFQIRNEEIEALKQISPLKDDKIIRNHEKELQRFLFGMDAECDECFIKQQQINKLKQLITTFKQQNTDLKSQLQTTTLDNKRILKNNSIYEKQFKNNQKIIIEQLQQKINQSVYQKIFLEQAKGIQNLIQCQKESNQKSNGNKYVNSTYQSATNNRQHHHANNIKQDVSEFTINVQRNGMSTINLKRPYFNKKEESDTLSLQKKNKTKNSLASTEKKKLSRLEKSKQKSHNDAINSKDKKNILANLCHRNKSQFSSNKAFPTKNAIDESDNEKQMQKPNIMTSDFLLTETDKEQQQQSILKNKHVIKKDVVEKNKNKNNFDKNGYDEKENDKMKGNNYAACNNTEEKYEKYMRIEYRKINLKDEQCYENYMRYHLRNSIMETLIKNGKKCTTSRDRRKSIQQITQRENSANQISKLSGRILPQRESEDEKLKDIGKKKGLTQKYFQLRF